MKEKINVYVVLLALIIGVYYIFLGVLLSTMNVSNGIEVTALVIPSILTGSLSTLLIQKLIRAWKLKKAGQTEDPTDNNDTEMK